MAYTMMHLWIADNVWKYIPNVKDYSTYFVGTIAPDAVHANEHFVIEQKEKSHLFTNNLKWGEVDTYEKGMEWLSNIKKYYFKNIHRYDYDFLTGYLIHLLVDIYNSLYFYTPFMKSIQNEYEIEVSRYKKESYAKDYELFCRYNEKHDLEKILRKGKSITLKGVITKDEIERRMKWLFANDFKNRSMEDRDGYHIYTPDAVEKLIQGATQFVRKVWFQEIE